MKQIHLVQAIKRVSSKLQSKYSDSPHHSFRVTPSLKKGRVIQLGVKEAWRLIVETVLFLVRYRKLFVWLVVVYATLTYLLVGGISQIDYTALKEQSGVFSDTLDAITKAAAYFGAALTGGLTQAPNQTQQLLSGVIMLLFWLSTVWLTRMLSAGKTVKLREAFYNGPTAFVSSLVVLLVMAAQLVPAALGLFAFTIAFTQGWVGGPVEGIAFGAAAVLLSLLSLYWLTGSVIATTVVALPGMYPMHALADARMLVMGRRWDIALRIAAMLIIQLLAWAVILLPAFIFDGWLDLPWLPLVPVLVQLMSGFSIIFSSVYIYKLYRSLL